MAAYRLRGSSIWRDRNDLPCGLGAIIRAAKGDLRQRVPQDPGGDRVTLGLIGVQQAFGRRPLDHLGQLPSQVHSVLNAEVEALSARRVMHVRGVAGQQDPAVAIGGGLTGRIVEPGDPSRTVNPVVRPIYRDERLAEIAKCRLASSANVRFGHEDPHQAGVVKLAEGMQTEGVVAHSPLRLLGQFDLSDQVADRRIRPGNAMPAALRITLRPPSHPTR